MHEGTRASSYDEDAPPPIVDGLMLVKIGWELVDGLRKVSSNISQQRQ